ncbi:hypothetical protein C7S16_5404 [Burkholderia thailandensis]|uniref:Uncharacterized protein n=1 Tax=Burkholderia thailandensis TaxID=57975 RepID=A0AAW9CTZ3_BURTH|nr:hypothetical protein [Burkholderia thailandensis]MDW9252513.1 hypothetical protein [Burkholderia thailandensis]
MIRSGAADLRIGRHMFAVPTDTSPPRRDRQQATRAAIRPAGSPPQSLTLFRIRFP